MSDDFSQEFISLRSQDAEQIEFDRKLGDARRVADQNAFAKSQENLISNVQEPQFFADEDGNVVESDKSGELNEGIDVNPLAQTYLNIGADVTMGVLQAADNTVKLIVGEDNVAKADAFIAKEFPEFMRGWEGFQTIVGAQTDSGPDRAVQEASKFFVPFFGFMRGLGLIDSGKKLTMVTKAVVAEAATSFTSLDPHMDRLAGMVKELGVQNEFINWLADNQDESETEGRFKNVLENTIGTGVVASVFPAVKLMKQLFNAPPKVSGSLSAQRGAVSLSKAKPKLDKRKKELLRRLKNLPIEDLDIRKLNIGDNPDKLRVDPADFFLVDRAIVEHPDTLSKPLP